MRIVLVEFLWHAKEIINNKLAFYFLSIYLKEKTKKVIKK